MDAYTAKDGIILFGEDIKFTKDSIVLSKKKINPKKNDSLDSIVGSLSGKRHTSYIANNNILYKVSKGLSIVPKKGDTVSELLLNYLSSRPNANEVAVMKLGKGKLIDPVAIQSISRKANTKDIPRSSKKELEKQATKLINSHFSNIPFYSKSKRNSIANNIKTIPETTLSKRCFDSILYLTKKSANRVGLLKNNVQQELDRIFFNSKPQELIVNVKEMHNDYKHEIADRIASDIGAMNYKVFRNIPFIAVPCSKKDMSNIMSSIKKNGFLNNSNSYSNKIKGVQKSSGFYTPELFLKYAKDMGLPATSFDFEAMDQGWNLRNIHAQAAWHYTKGAGSVALIIDTGVDYEHPELRDAFEGNKGTNYVDSNDDPMDDNGHGTHVAGITAGKSLGVAPQGTLYAAKVLDANGSGSNTDVIAAIDDAITDSQIDIINMSLGSSVYSYALNAVCKKAYENGIIVCAAAGNEGYGADYPAACDGVISVAAVDCYNRHANFSNIDSSVDISCPGVKIYSSYPNRGYKELSGTSMASPHAAGVATLASSLYSNLDSRAFESIMVKTAFELGEGESLQDEKYGAGLIMADEIMKQLKNKKLRRFRIWK